MRCRRLFGWAVLCTTVFCLPTSLLAAIKLPAILGDNMVLQRGRPVPIWGWADPGEDVTVAIAGQTASAKADAKGRWQATLPALTAADPVDMKITGASSPAVTVKNILLGEVWICSGQSNMERGIGMFTEGAKEIAAADHPLLRLFIVEKAKAAQPAADVKGHWVVCTPQNVAAGGRSGFSATGYYFGRDLQQALKAPVGMIQSAWGGTPCKFWTSRAALQANPELAFLTKQQDSSSLYNGMIAPLVPFAIRGAVWYQGENDVGRAMPYHTLFATMIADWRKAWRQGDFPFGFVQLAPFRYQRCDPAAWAELCEAQRQTLDVPNTGMAVTVDIGDPQDIHPQHKPEVGRRLALWALATVYGRDLVYSGPVYKSMQVEGDKIRLTFDHVDGGLQSADGKPLNEFTIAGADRKFVPATAEIDGSALVVHSDAVAKPAAVRFAWHDCAQPNLTNKAGLPAGPFRTDAWPRKSGKP